MKKRTIDHLTHITYNRETCITHFNLLSLPLELILHIISYLDYPELSNLSYCNKFTSWIIHCYQNYLSSLQIDRIRTNLDVFLKNRPTINELYHKRILKHRFIHILIQPYIWNRLEMFELLAFMLRKRSLNKLLQKRPTRSDLIKRGILKPPKFNNIDELDKEFVTHLPKPVLTNDIAMKIKILENFKIEEILKNFLHRYQSQKFNTIITGDGRFLDKLNFFENFTASECGRGSILGMDNGKKRKRILRANVIGNKVFFD